jgi:hypothetical protein
MNLMVSANLWLAVEFDYQPYEPPERGPEAQYPGCAEAIEINKVWLGTSEISDALSPTELAEIEAEIWRVLADQSRALDAND